MVGRQDGRAGAEWLLGKAEAVGARRTLRFPAWATENSGAGAPGSGANHEFIWDM